VADRAHLLHVRASDVRAGSVAALQAHGRPDAFMERDASQ
jgi:hypothetical protein